MQPEMSPENHSCVRQFHFRGARDTNRCDKPEWFFQHLSMLIRDKGAFLEQRSFTAAIACAHQSVACRLQAVCDRARQNAPMHTSLKVRVKTNTILDVLILRRMRWPRFLSRRPERKGTRTQRRSDEELDEEILRVSLQQLLAAGDMFALAHLMHATLQFDASLHGEHGAGVGSCAAVVLGIILGYQVHQPLPLCRQWSRGRRMAGIRARCRDGEYGAADAIAVVLAAIL